MASSSVLLPVLLALCISYISARARSIESSPQDGPSLDLESAVKRNESEITAETSKLPKIGSRSMSTNRQLKKKNRHEYHDGYPILAPVEKVVKVSEPINVCPIEACLHSDAIVKVNKIHKDGKLKKKIKNLKKKEEQLKKVIEERFKDSDDEEPSRTNVIDLANLLQLNPNLGNPKEGFLESIGKNVAEGGSAIEQLIGEHLGLVLPTKTERQSGPLEKLREAQDSIAEQGEKVVDDIIDLGKDLFASPPGSEANPPARNSNPIGGPPKQTVPLISLLEVIDLLARIGLNPKVLADPEFPLLISDLKASIVSFKSSQA